MEGGGVGGAFSAEPAAPPDIGVVGQELERRRRDGAPEKGWAA